MKAKKMFISTITMLIFLQGFSQRKPISELKEKMMSKNDTARINASNEIGSTYLLAGKLDSADYYLQIGLKEAEQKKYDKGIGDAYNSLGNINLIKGRHEEAMTFYLKALALREKNGVKKEIIPVYINISTVNVRQKQFSESRAYLNKAWQMAIEIKDSVRLAGIQNNYATILANTGGSFDSILFYLRNCVDISNKIENNERVDKDQLNHYKKNALLGIAQVLSRKGEGKQITQMLDSLWQKGSSSEGIPNKLRILRIITEAAMNDSNFHKAIDYANAAIQMDSGYNNPVLMVDFYSLLSDSYLGLGDYKNAYKATIPHLRFKDSLYAKSKLDVTNEMLAKYESQKKNEQILQLNKDKKTQRIIAALFLVAAIVALGLLAFALRSRKLQQKVFKQKEDLLLKEKEIENKALEQKMTELEQMALRAQMNPHFIFNSLNSVQHFVMNKDVEGVNKYLGAFAHLIRQTLNNSGKPLIPLDEEMKYLDTYLSLEKMKSNNRFSYAITADPGIDAGNTLIPGMILQPFVENSIKHGVGHKENNDGLVRIRISKNGKLVCQIEDNGIGRQKAGEIKSASPKTAYEPKGMDITLHRIETINKMYNTLISVQVTDLLDAAGNPSGTRVTVLLPPDME